MKTAISIPNQTFDRVERNARCLGITRSEFYARAAAYYLDHLEQQSLTDDIDAALDAIGEADDSSTLAVEAGKRTLARTEDEW